MGRWRGCAISTWLLSLLLLARVDGQLLQLSSLSVPGNRSLVGQFMFYARASPEVSLAKAKLVSVDKTHLDPMIVAVVEWSKFDTYIDESHFCCGPGDKGCKVGRLRFKQKPPPATVFVQYLGAKVLSVLDTLEGPPGAYLMFLASCAQEAPMVSLEGILQFKTEQDGLLPGDKAPRVNILAGFSAVYLLLALSWTARVINNGELRSVGFIFLLASVAALMEAGCAFISSQFWKFSGTESWVLAGLEDLGCLHKQLLALTLLMTVAKNQFALDATGREMRLWGCLIFPYCVAYVLGTRLQDCSTSRLLMPLVVLVGPVVAAVLQLVIFCVVFAELSRATRAPDIKLEDPLLRFQKVLRGILSILVCLCGLLLVPQFYILATKATAFWSYRWIVLDVAPRGLFLLGFLGASCLCPAEVASGPGSRGVTAADAEAEKEESKGFMDAHVEDAEAIGAPAQELRSVVEEEEEDDEAPRTSGAAASSSGSAAAASSSAEPNGHGNPPVVPDLLGFSREENSV
eukprot:TRINITY_DN71517_c0_g1_i1.p1 TRINITY_DN71517_c0_g1~~TRINITY_DN71517_c0_g1_i1.p1  ORF type:complete len:517 (-),score=135.36 TRINITY_DN71517_c0_g1_i1:89-1639(-)